MYSQVGVISKLVNFQIQCSKNWKNNLKIIIFWKYLNRYYSKLLSQCYYQVSIAKLLTWPVPSIMWAAFAVNSQWRFQLVWLDQLEVQ